jgi:cytochrome c oxidase subunit IV
MPEKKPQSKPVPAAPDQHTVREYIQANLLVWGFLAILGVVSFFICGGVMDDVTEGTLEFLFVIVGCGFTLVSILDYLYDRYAGSHTKAEEKHT